MLRATICENGLSRVSGGLWHSISSGYQTKSKIHSHTPTAETAEYKQININVYYYLIIILIIFYFISYYHLVYSKRNIYFKAKKLLFSRRTFLFMESSRPICQLHGHRGVENRISIRDSSFDFLADLDSLEMFFF